MINSSLKSISFILPMVQLFTTRADASAVWILNLVNLLKGFILADVPAAIIGIHYL